jgi:hypothetical protein
VEGFGDEMACVLVLVLPSSGLLIQWDASRNQMPRLAAYGLQRPDREEQGLHLQPVQARRAVCVDDCCAWISYMLSAVIIRQTGRALE